MIHIEHQFNINMLEDIRIALKNNFVLYDIVNFFNKDKVIIVETFKEF